MNKLEGKVNPDADISDTGHKKKSLLSRESFLGKIGGEVKAMVSDVIFKVKDCLANQDEKDSNGYLTRGSRRALAKLNRESYKRERRREKYGDVHYRDGGTWQARSLDAFVDTLPVVASMLAGAGVALALNGNPSPEETSNKPKIEEISTVVKGNVEKTLDSEKIFGVPGDDMSIPPESISPEN